MDCYVWERRGARKASPVCLLWKVVVEGPLVVIVVQAVWVWVVVQGVCQLNVSLTLVLTQQACGFKVKHRGHRTKFKLKKF